MSENNFPVDLRGITEPATKLIEAVRDAIGILYEPTAIRRKAKAEGDAMVLLAKSQAETREIEARASERLINRELRRQKNIEKITQQALEALPESTSKEPVDEDWIYRFFEDCQDVSDAEMQSLWGRLLAGEVSQPGRFSFRTLRVVRDLTKSDALLFTRLCSFVWDVVGLGLTPVIQKVEQEDVTRAGLDFPAFLHLSSLGLLEFNSLAGFSVQKVSQAALIYHDRHHLLSSSDGRNFDIGKVLLTSVGKELAAISGATACESYRVAMVEAWRADGWLVEEHGR